MTDPHDRINERLDEAGLDTERFVDVHDGEKGTYDHTQLPKGEIDGNYGIYANADDRLVLIDIDDYDDLDDSSGLVALTHLPTTLEQKSPHGGTHKIYAVEQTVDGKYIAEVLEEEIGKENPTPTWGEVRVSNQFIVGAGSELDGCDKDWCDDCQTDDGGSYSLHSDREIATISPGDLVDVLQKDPNYAPDDQSEEDGGDSVDSDIDSDADAEDILAYALQDSDDSKIQRLWRGNYSDYSGDRSRAESALAFKLAFWLGSLPNTKSLVESAMDGKIVPDGSPKPQLEKWELRSDGSYRDSVLDAVDKQTDYFDPDKSTQPTSPKEIDQRFEDEDPDGTPDTEGDSPSWDWVRSMYEDSDTSKQYARYAAVRKLEADMEFATPRQTEHLLSYNEDLGIYERGGRLDVERELRRGLGPHYSTHEASEIVSALKAGTYVDMDVFDAGGVDEKLLCVENGVLDLETRELHAHDPEYYFRSRLPVEHDPDADCPSVEKFMADITAREPDRLTMYEMIGNALWPNYDHNSFGVLFGPGGNGKSTFFELVEHLLGSENVSGWGLKDLEENRFATANLVDKMANIAPDLEGKKIHDLGTLKALTGGDTVMAERKGEQAFEYENRAMLMFGANKPPVLGERSDAIKRRLLPIHLPERFTSDPDDEHKDARDRAELMSELTTEKELSGLLNKALDGLERLNETGDYSLPETPDERLELYEKHSDPIKEFRVTCLQNTRGEIVQKDAVYNAYKRFCEVNDHNITAKNVFFRQLRQTTLTYEEKQVSMPDGSRPRHLADAEFTGQGLEFCPDSVLTKLNMEEDEEDELTDGVTPIEELGDVSNPYVDLTVEIVSWDATEDEVVAAGGPCEEGTVRDITGIVDVVDFVGIDRPSWNEGDRVMLEDARVSSYDGRIQVELVEKLTQVSHIGTGAGYSPSENVNDEQTSLDESGDEAATDGGEAGAVKPDSSDEDEPNNDDPEKPPHPFDTPQCRDCGTYWNMEDEPREACPDCGADLDWEWMVETARVSEKNMTTDEGDLEGVRSNIDDLKNILRRDGGDVKKTELIAKSEMQPGRAEKIIKKACERGEIDEVGDGVYRI